MEEFKECPWCGRSVPAREVRTRRKYTMYVGEHLNFMTSCKRCFQLAEEQWQILYDEARASRL